MTHHFQRTKLITSSTDKHYSLDSEEDLRSGCRPHPDDHTSRTAFNNCYLGIKQGTFSLTPL